jgi:hypothetical protein
MLWHVSSNVKPPVITPTSFAPTNVHLLECDLFLDHLFL